ncbi:Integrase [Cupriavidus necator H850]|uniref:tyrosine-type recombinase/integrase n=1 Tax=Cupriavidus necator TaxID=106590 RepID=UPI00129E211E|nr:site-specific integrase [Cupriavidus necator]KAI3606292.1 Integrase [Cupriavidus necator H850]
MANNGGRTINRLSALRVTRVDMPGYHHDGGGLYLQVSPVGAKSWIFRFKLHGRAREMGLGSLNTIALADARQKATECRKLLLDGVDPIEARNAARARDRLEAAQSMTFSACATAYIAAHRASWKNVKHSSQWESTIETYANPVIGPLSVKQVDTSLVMRILEPIWQSKPETASRLRGRIESILDWATARSYRAGENPARWRGHLDSLLPASSKIRRVQHHPALPYEQLGLFLQQLRAQPGVAAKALEFLILTAARTGEVIGARWGEFDFDKNVWTCPPDRMKSSRPHRVPLCPATMKILKDLSDTRTSDYVFQGGKADKPLSNMAMLAVLKRMGRTDLTCHGFRSTFRDWAAEQTNFAREVAEAALAHTVGDKVEAAYRRGDLFEKRRSLMTAWAKHCARTVSQNNNVVPIKAAVA